MMKYFSLLVGLVLISTLACHKVKDGRSEEDKNVDHKELDFGKTLEQISFGSCNKEWLEQSYWDIIANEKLDLWLWLGDIIYADTEDMNVMEMKYNQLYNNEFYKKFRSSTSIIGIWDDHDYGINDGCKYYTMKDESKKLLFDFLNVPKDDPSNDRKGAYQSYTIGQSEQKIKIILLDARYFRDSLVRDSVGPDRYKKNMEGSILGEQQWIWLKKELASSQAQLNIICSGIQILHTEQYFEKWNNFPKERQKLLRFIEANDNKNILLISGDRHISELAKISINNHEIYEVTSSGLTHIYAKNQEPNQFRVGEMIKEKNFATLSFNWKNKSLECILSFKNMDGKALSRNKWKYNL